jgi:hypothetical protein
MNANNNPYLFINNIRNEVRLPSPMLMALIMSCKFNGDVYTNGDSFIVNIDGKYFDCFNEVDLDNFDAYVKFDTLSLLTIADLYEDIKWFFIEQSRDEYYDDFYLN